MRRALVLALALPAVLAGEVAAEVTLHEVGRFDSPVYVAGAPGDHTRLYVVEQAGTIQVVSDGVARQFVDLRDAVRAPGDAGAGNEEGLLSVAFAPDFESSRLLYVYFTDPAGNNRVEELRAPTGDAAEVASRRLVISLEHPTFANHNGGQLQFGADGLLYLAPGDGGAGNDPAGNAQSLASPLGKILRIDPRGGLSYRVPPDNPFFGQAGAREEIWAYGLRNPFRFSFDRATGDLIVADVGQSTTEEVDFAPASAGAGRGANFGWDLCEGSYAAGSEALPCPLAGSVAPVIDKLQSQGYCSVIGGYVVRDPSLPSLAGRYVYGDLCQSRLRTAALSASGAIGDREIGPSVEVTNVTSFGEDTAGCVYVTSAGGRVYRLVERDTRVPCPGPAGPAGPAPADPPVADTTGPGLRTYVPRRQRVLKLRGAVAYVRCREDCGLSAGGRLIVGDSAYRLRRGSRLVPAGRRVRVKLVLTRRARRALRRRLDGGRRAQVRVGLRARDATGNRSPLVRVLVRVSS